MNRKVELDTNINQNRTAKNKSTAHDIDMPCSLLS